MRNYLILGICFFAIAATAQLPYGIGGMGAFDHTDRLLINSSNNAIVKGIFDNRQVEEGKYNFQAGLIFDYKWNEKIWFQSGFKLSSVGYFDRKFTDLLWPSEVDVVTGAYTRDPSLPHESRLHYDYWMLTIPVRVKYFFKTGRLKPYAMAGVAAGYYTGTRATEVTDVYKRSNFFVVDQFRKINMSIDLGIGLQWMWMEDFGLFLQPSARYYFTRLVAKAPIKEYLYAFGVEAGFVKYFGKKQKATN